MPDLHECLRGWSPGPVELSEHIDAAPMRALAGVLDVVLPDERNLPPLWHWLHLLERPTHADLGADGHPRHGHFLPPIPQRRRMIAGGRVEVRAPVPVGATLTRRSALAGVQVKTGRSGQLAFVAVRQEYRCAADLLVIEEQDVVYRSQPPGAVRELAAPPSSDEHHPTKALRKRTLRASARTPDQPAEWRFTVYPDETMLFRFSALTYNAHRIHYDHPYATGVEGYPGLVVHGPLLALLLLEIPRRELPGEHVDQVAYRLRAPAFAGESIAVRGWRTEDGLALRAEAGGRLLATATARLRAPG